jgi:hypothetical protein
VFLSGGWLPPIELIRWAASIVRPLLHLLSIILVLPGVILASAFIILGRAIAAQSLLGMFGQLLADAVWIIPWGLLAACTIVLLIGLGGFFIRTRRTAAICVAILGIGSMVVLLALTSDSSASLESLTFFIPAVVASGIGLWLAFVDGRNQNTTIVTRIKVAAK